MERMSEQEQKRVSRRTEYDEETTVARSPDDDRMRYKKPGIIPAQYRGPYAGARRQEVGENETSFTHNPAVKEERDEPDYINVSVNERAGMIKPGSDEVNTGEDSADSGDDEKRDYDGFSRKDQFDAYVKKNGISTPTNWSDMSVADRRGWLDENT